MEKEEINYYEEGEKIGNYSVFNNKFVVDRNNNILLQKDSISNTVFGFHDIICKQDCEKTYIYDSKDLSLIKEIKGKLFCDERLNNKYLVNLKGGPDGNDFRLLDSDFNEIIDKENIYDIINSYYIYQYDNGTIRIILEFSSGELDVFDENFNLINKSKMPYEMLLDQDTAIVGFDGWYYFYDLKNKEFKQKDNTNFEFKKYKVFDISKALIAVREADCFFYIINYKTLEKYSTTRYQDIDECGEGLFSASIEGVNGIYNTKNELVIDLPYTSCSLPFKHGIGIFHVGDKYLKSKGYELPFVIEEDIKRYPHKTNDFAIQVNDLAIVELGHKDLLQTINNPNVGLDLIKDWNYQVVINTEGKILYVLNPFRIPVYINKNNLVVAEEPYEEFGVSRTMHILYDAKGNIIDRAPNYYIEKNDYINMGHYVSNYDDTTCDYVELEHLTLYTNTGELVKRNMTEKELYEILESI